MDSYVVFDMHCQIAFLEKTETIFILTDSSHSAVFLIVYLLVIMYIYMYIYNYVYDLQIHIIIYN
jgi:hypothetical protein